MMAADAADEADTAAAAVAPDKADTAAAAVVAPDEADAAAAAVAPDKPDVVAAAVAPDKADAAATVVNAVAGETTDRCQYRAGIAHIKYSIQYIQSRATGIADHILPLGDWFFFVLIGLLWILWVTLGHCRSFWVILSRLGSFWLVLSSSEEPPGWGLCLLSFFGILSGFVIVGCLVLVWF